VDNDPLTYAWDFGDGSGGSDVTPTHVYADNGVYTVTLTVSDGANTSTSTLTVTVLNVAPAAALTGPVDGVPGQELTYTFSATDPSAVDQAGTFTYQIAWGDGSTDTVQGPASGVQVVHVYTDTGLFTPSVTATDKDGGSGDATGPAVSIAAAELQNGDLVIGGTTGDDHITIQPVDADGTVDVIVNGQDQGTFAPTGKIVVNGLAGNDVIEAIPGTAPDSSILTVAVPVVFLGGDGDDTLDARGVSAPAILSGGNGNDTLWGGSGRSLLLGGAGADTLSGGSADDLLVGGASSHDANLTALLALQAEWNRTDADYLTRISHLDGTVDGGLNGGYLLTAQTVTDDAAVDALFGDVGQDWFFAASGGDNPDQVLDQEPGELIVQL
jgi:PKD repeat protein